MLGNQVLEAQAVLAVEIGLLAKFLPTADMTLAFSLEAAAVPADYFTDFALTEGRQAEEAAIFKNNMQNLVQGSKLLA